MYNWINDLKAQGYKYMFTPLGVRGKFYATKETKRKKNGYFYAEALFDEFKLEKGESWIPGHGTRGVIIDLCN